jgi:hypothetical protein
VPEGWIIPQRWYSWYKQKFRAEASDEERDVQYAEWRVKGPRTYETKADVLRVGRTVSSTHTPKLKEPGEYTVTCAFLPVYLLLDPRAKAEFEKGP